VAAVMGLLGMPCNAGVPYRAWWSPVGGSDELRGEAMLAMRIPQPVFAVEDVFLVTDVWAAHYLEMEDKPPVRKGKLRLYATTPVLACFARNVAGNLADVEMQTPHAIYREAHITMSFTSDSMELNKADVVIWNGLGIDQGIDFEEAMQRRADRARLEGVNIRVVTEPAPLPPDPLHRNDFGAKAKPRKKEEYEMGHAVFLKASEGIAAKEHMVPWELFTLAPGRGLAPGGKAPEGQNPYVWLDPVLAIREVENIRDALMKADPLHAFLYVGNANAYVRRLRALDAEARMTAAGLKRKHLLGIGDEFAYFLSRYGIEQTGVCYPNIGGELFGGSVEYFRQLLAERPSDGLIFPREPLLEEARWKFADLGLPMAELDPMETGDGAADYYERVTHANLDALSTTLK